MGAVGKRAEILGISGTESICAGEQTLAGARMAAEGLIAALPIARCDQAFRSLGTRRPEPDSSRVVGSDPSAACIRNRPRRDRRPTRSVRDYAESHAMAHCSP